MVLLCNQGTTLFQDNAKCFDEWGLHANEIFQLVGAAAVWVGYRCPLNARPSSCRAPAAVRVQHDVNGACDIINNIQYVAGICIAGDACEI